MSTWLKTTSKVQSKIGKLKNRLRIIITRRTSTYIGQVSVALLGSIRRTMYGKLADWCTTFDGFGNEPGRGFRFALNIVSPSRSIKFWFVLSILLELRNDAPEKYTMKCLAGYSCGNVWSFFGQFTWNYFCLKGVWRNA